MILPDLSSVSGRATPLAPDDSLRAACREFEGVFLGVLLQQMEATVPRSGLLPLGSSGEMFRSLWVQEVGRLASASSPLGLADLLVRSLSSPAPSPDEDVAPGLKHGPPGTEDESEASASAASRSASGPQWLPLRRRR